MNALWEKLHSINKKNPLNLSVGDYLDIKNPLFGNLKLKIHYIDKIHETIYFFCNYDNEEIVIDCDKFGDLTIRVN